MRAALSDLWRTPNQLLVPVLHDDAKLPLWGQAKRASHVAESLPQEKGFTPLRGRGLQYYRMDRHVTDFESGFPCLTDCLATLALVPARRDIPLLDILQLVIFFAFKQEHTTIVRKNQRQDAERDARVRWRLLAPLGGRGTIEAAGDEG